MFTRRLPLPSAPLKLWLPALLLASTVAGAQVAPAKPSSRDSLAAKDTATAILIVQALDSAVNKAVALGLPSTSSLTVAALRGQPGSSSGSASAYGAEWGDVFGGGGYQKRTRFTDQSDGSVSAGFGLGNPTQYVGLEVAIASASTFRQGFYKNGSVSLKLHRILPHYYGVAVGFENVANWGGTDGGASVYGVVSNNFQFRDDTHGFLGSLAWNLGIGNNRFLSEQALFENKKGYNVFASGGLRLNQQMALVMDWTGQDLASVISFVPFKYSPLVMSAGFADVTRRAGDGPRFILSAGVGMKARDLFGFGKHDSK